jgi:hypothetical protein
MLRFKEAFWGKYHEKPYKDKIEEYISNDDYDGFVKLKDFCEQHLDFYFSYLD